MRSFLEMTVLEERLQSFIDV